MGAWGAGLFESDQDFDIAYEISDEAGMDLGSPDDTEAGGKGLENTISAMNGGIFTKLFDKYKRPDHIFQFHSNKYYLVILMALSMRLGVDIDEEQKAYARSVVKSAGLYKEGIVQFQKALDEYVNGTPHTFEPSGVCDMLPPRKGGFQLTNHLAPRYYQDDVPTQDLARAIIEDLDKTRCNGCDRTELTFDKGQKVKYCARCKTARYCSKKCQKMDWKEHKKVCGELANKRARNEEKESGDAGQQVG